MLNEILICLYIQKDRGTPSMLGKNQRTSRLAYLIHKGGGICSKFREGPDIFGWKNFRHNMLLSWYLMTYH